MPRLSSQAAQAVTPVDLQRDVVQAGVCLVHLLALVGIVVMQTDR
jgi:hypothetical protein